MEGYYFYDQVDRVESTLNRAFIIQMELLEALYSDVGLGDSFCLIDVRDLRRSGDTNKSCFGVKRLQSLIDDGFVDQLAEDEFSISPDGEMRLSAMNLI
jgi:hypothetical protein